MSAKLQDLTEFYSDLLLLRVEKSTLAAMKGQGSAVSEQDAIAKGEQRLSASLKLFAQKAAAKEEEAAKGAKAVQQRREENVKLRAQLEQLGGSVAAREAIFKARAESGADGGAASAAAARLKRVAMRRRLIDLAKAQTEEIEFLRGELDRLRQRTFPSFAAAARSKLLLPPDEVL